MPNYSSELFRRNIEGAMGESIEESNARPLDVRADIDAGRFGKPPQMMVGCYNPKTRKYTKNLREIFSDCERAYRGAVKVPLSQRILGFFNR
jgi:hypothetical protein